MCLFLFIQLCVLWGLLNVVKAVFCLSLRRWCSWVGVAVVPFPPLSLPSPSLSARAHVVCVRCSDPAVGRVARCADEGGELCSPFFLSATDTILGRRAFAVARPETAMTNMKQVESICNDLHVEPRTRRELSTRSPAQQHLVCVY